jgi:hypothetical protein
MRRPWIATIAIAGLLALPAAATAAEERAPAPPEVRVTPRYEPETPRQPGWTLIEMHAPLLWRVTLTVRAHGAVVLEEQPKLAVAGSTEGDPSVIPSTTKYESLVFWSCKQPGTVYTYTVTAEWGDEPPLTSTGRFPGATQRQCDDALRLSLRRHHEEVHRQQAQARRRRGEELARQHRFEANCRIVGGKPVTIQTARGPEIVCRSQSGGIVEA